MQTWEIDAFVLLWKEESGGFNMGGNIRDKRRSHKNSSLTYLWIYMCNTIEKINNLRI